LIRLTLRRKSATPKSPMAIADRLEAGGRQEAVRGVYI